METWLFLDSGSAPGAENMALDELLLDRVEERGGPPVLRLYSFAPPAVTVGFHQDPGLILDLDAVREDGLEVVRRITGGRALLHERELTYCVVAPAGTALFDAGRGDAFRRVSAAIADALRSIGVDAVVSRGREFDGPKGSAAPCLSSVTRHELAAGGRKIAGNAQRRTARALLQHGSILVGSGSERIVRYLRGAPGPLGDRVTSVSRELGRAADAEDLRARVAASFSRAFSAAYEPFLLTERDEEDIAERARAKRRESLSWTAGEVAGR